MRSPSCLLQTEEGLLHSLAPFCWDLPFLQEVATPFPFKTYGLVTRRREVFSAVQDVRCAQLPQQVQAKAGCASQKPRAVQLCRSRKDGFVFVYFLPLENSLSISPTKSQHTEERQEPAIRRIPALAGNADMSYGQILLPKGQGANIRTLVTLVRHIIQSLYRMLCPLFIWSRITEYGPKIQRRLT